MCVKWGSMFIQKSKINQKTITDTIRQTTALTQNTHYFYRRPTPYTQITPFHPSPTSTLLWFCRSSFAMSSFSEHPSTSSLLCSFFLQMQSSFAFPDVLLVVYPVLCALSRWFIVEYPTGSKLDWVQTDGLKWAKADCLIIVGFPFLTAESMRSGI